jgi:dephospho-CoA kinase
MSVVLVTGMSGAGKSSVLAELARRGHRVVDTDHDGYIEEVRLAGQLEPERLWREDRMTALLKAHSDGALFVAGTVANQRKFYPHFDAVVLLTAPVEVLLARVVSRTANDFGKRAEERERIAADTAAVEPLLRKGATLEIDTRIPLEDVADAVSAAAATRSMPQREDSRRT